MYDIRQFKPTLYVLLVLGLCGYGLAMQAPGLWLLSMVCVCLNAWLVKTGRFKPLPRLAASLITLIALVYVLLEILRRGLPPIFGIAEFLVLLQLIKLFEQRGNRDYAQMVVLSLLLVVASAMSAASLLFGLILVAYLFLSLYCCLLFHLKVESDQAREAFALPAEKINPATLQQDQRYLGRSMRRLMALVSFSAIGMAVIVFLMFPRGGGSGVLAQLQLPGQGLTGFSDEVSFQQVVRIGQNPRVAAHVKLYKDGQLIKGTELLLLRGLTLDNYTGDNPDVGEAWKWRRDPSMGLTSPATLDRPIAVGTEGVTGRWRQEVSLEPSGGNTLFAIPGPVSFTSRRDGRLELRVNRRDQALEAIDPLTAQTDYEVLSTGTPASAADIDWIASADNLLARLMGFLPTSCKSRMDPTIREFARRPEVSGSNAQGPLAQQRPRYLTVHPLDEAIAGSIERYLSSTFTYTLDLTDTRRIEGRDPLVAFLYDFKRGHCEYFAGAMTLMCQSLGLQSRMVIGFKCDDFNPVSGQYIVRQSHAHAWCEVLTLDGWKTFDPTSSRNAPTIAKKQTGFFAPIRNLMDFLEYKWQSSVVAYDMNDRQLLIANVGMRMDRVAFDGSQHLQDVWKAVMGKWNGMLDKGWELSSILFSALIGLSLAGMVLSILWYLYGRWRLRRRAVRIGIDVLPASEQVRLARQLGFYDELLQTLERHRIIRPPHLTPREFAQSLSFLPAETYDRVHRLTELFYRIRFGRLPLKPSQRRRVRSVIPVIDQALSATHAHARI